MKTGLIVALFAVSLLPVSAVHAGPYADDLSKCLIKSTTASDKSSLVQWMFFAMALNSNVSTFVSIPKEKRDQADKGTAQLFERLLTDSCKNETQAASKYEGSAAIGEAFRLLGQVATQEMMTDAAVAKGIGAFVQYLDKSRLEGVFGQSKGTD